MKHALAGLLGSVVLLSGCSMLKVQLPGVGNGTSNNTASSSASDGEVADSTPKVDPKRAVDCSKVTADPNGTQPSDADREALAAAHGDVRPEIANVEVVIKNMESLPIAEKIVADSIAKFGPWWCASVWADGSLAPNEHERSVVSLRNKIAQVKKQQAADPQTAKADLDAALAKALQRLAEYKAVPTLRFDNQDVLTSSSSDVNREIDLTAVYHLNQMKLALGESAPEVVTAKASIDQAREKVKLTVEEISDLLADRYEMPKDVYKRPDAKQVKAAFTRSMPGKKILTVVLVNDWDRRKGTEWHGEKLVTYDQSWIHGNVIIQADARTAEVWKVIARKDHLDGDKIKFDTYVPQLIGKMRVKNVKR